MPAHSDFLVLLDVAPSAHIYPAQSLTFFAYSIGLFLCSVSFHLHYHCFLLLLLSDPSHVQSTITFPLAVSLCCIHSLGEVR